MFNKITEHICIYPAEHYTDRPNIGLIVGEEKSLLFDAGNSEKHVEKMKKELSEQGLPFPDYVLLSHWHWDHSFGAKFWKAPIISGRKTDEKLREVMNWKWDDFYFIPFGIFAFYHFCAENDIFSGFYPVFHGKIVPFPVYYFTEFFIGFSSGNYRSFPEFCTEGMVPMPMGK